jgi:citrate lyase subunit beta/citryl-CoA lyase
MELPRLRRSCLSLPATRPRFHDKAEELAADELVFDLEDSVAPAAKQEGRAAVVKALQSHAYSGKLVSVRVNAVDTPWCFDDVVTVLEGAGNRVDCVVLPKVQASHVHFLDHLLNQLERKLGLEQRVGLELLIESAGGLSQVEKSAAVSDRTQALLFGPGDLAASLQMPDLTIGQEHNEYPGHLWHYAMSRILLAARTNGLQAIDGPWARVHDIEGLRQTARLAATMGFDGKWAINPGQIEVLNEAFSPSQANFERASEILDAYALATEGEHTGAVMLGEEMIDEATRRMAEVTVGRGRALGMIDRRREVASDKRPPEETDSL